MSQQIKLVHESGTPKLRKGYYRLVFEYRMEADYCDANVGNTAAIMSRANDLFCCLSDFVMQANSDAGISERTFIDATNLVMEIADAMEQGNVPVAGTSAHTPHAGETP